MQPRLSGESSDKARIIRLEEVLRNRVEFGDPQEPDDPASTTAAGSSTTAHNGRPDNIFGSWVEVTFDAADAATLCRHNLDMPIVNAELNVRWMVFAFQHSGVGVNAASTLSINYDTRDSAAILADSLNLRLYVGGGRTIAAGANAVKVSLFFTPATRGVL